MQHGTAGTTYAVLCTYCCTSLERRGNLFRHRCHQVKLSGTNDVCATCIIPDNVPRKEYITSYQIKRYPVALTMLFCAASSIGTAPSVTTTLDIRFTCASNRFVLSAGSSIVRSDTDQLIQQCRTAKRRARSFSVPIYSSQVTIGNLLACWHLSSGCLVRLWTFCSMKRGVAARRGNHLCYRRMKLPRCRTSICCQWSLLSRWQNGISCIRWFSLSQGQRGSHPAPVTPEVQVGCGGITDQSERLLIICILHRSCWMKCSMQHSRCIHRDD